MVPSNSIRVSSINSWLLESKPVRVLFIAPLIKSTLEATPLPPYLKESLSLSSEASLEPVEAPEGTAALPIEPDSKNTSASKVGFPLESIISLAVIFLIFDFIVFILL